MTTKTRRAFTDEFKREAVLLLEGSGRPLTQVVVELGVQPSMLRAWRGNGTMMAGLDLLAAEDYEPSPSRLARDPQGPLGTKLVPTKSAGLFR